MRYQIKSQGRDAIRSEPASALRSQLTHQEAELDARRQLLRHEIASEMRDVRDSAEYSADQSAFGVNAALLEVTAHTMRSIEDALDRLRTRSFGKCIDCETSIPQARLEALPFAQRCRDCQERHDEDARSKTEVVYHPL